MIKVRFFDKRLIKNYFEVLTILSVLSSLAFIAIDIPDKFKLTTGVVLILLFLTIYIILWIRANSSNRVKLKINNSIIDIKVGDIFEENGLKIVAFNEYFDTQVDNKVISETTLNGIYIKKLVGNVDELDNLMNTDAHLRDKILLEDNSSRPYGKKKKFRLGTIFQHNDYLLTAFSRFDNDNRAYLHMNDYINFLLNFWNEIDILYAGRSVSIPLLGSGITRLKEYNMISDQELLELLIWSFKVSRIKFTYPSQVSIIVHESKKDKINFYNLRSVENGL